MLATAGSAAAGDGRRAALLDSSPAPAVSLSSSGPLRALLSFRLSDLLFLALGCAALLASLDRQGEWRLQRHALIAHSMAAATAEPFALPFAEPAASSQTASLRPEPLVADLDGDAHNG